MAESVELESDARIGLSGRQIDRQRRIQIGYFSAPDLDRATYDLRPSLQQFFDQGLVTCLPRVIQQWLSARTTRHASR